MPEMVSDHIELLAPFLACADLCKLAQTCKGVKKAAETIEDDVFGAHKLVRVINRARRVDSPPAVLCTHISSEGRRTLMSVPLPFGNSPKGTLRAIEQYWDIWKRNDVCVRVHLKEEHESGDPYPVTEELLFVTPSYSENMCKRFVFMRILDF